MGGYRDAAPTQAHGEQALKCAAMYGAVAAMLAVTEAELTGLGQHVDISMQESVTLALENAAQTYDLEGVVRKRPLGDQRFAGYGLFECKDGYIFLGSRGIGNSPAWTRSLQWFKDEGMDGVDRLFGPEWSDLQYLKGDEAREVFGELFMRWSRQHTKAWLYSEGQKRLIPLAPVSTPADLLDNPQLQARGHFVEFTHPLLKQAARMPGAPYVLSPRRGGYSALLRRLASTPPKYSRRSASRRKKCRAFSPRESQHEPAGPSQGRNTGARSAKVTLSARWAAPRAEVPNEPERAARR